MSPAPLLEHFDRIGDVPDAVPMLRRFIRDLAVRGRLLEPGANDGLPHERLRPQVEQGSPYQVPAHWAWAQVGDVADCRLGKMLDKAKNKGTPRRYLRNVNVRWFDFDLSDIFEMRFEDSELDEFALRRGDVLICEGGEPGRAGVWDEREEDVYFQKAIHRVRFAEAVDPHFFVNVIRASADSGRLAHYFTGVGIKHFTGRGLASFRFAVPPLAEQRCIVAKVDELMSLCDRFEAAQAERERRRDRLAAASVQRLNVPDDTSAVREHADFHLRHLERFTTRPDQIPGLREAILNFAVRGQLGPQKPNDEPSLRLLQRIQSTPRNGATGATNGRHRAGETHEALFEIPASWLWIRLGDVFDVAGGIQKTPHRAPKNNAFPYLGVANVYRGRLDLTTVKQFELQEGELEKRRLEPGDLLIIEGNGSLTEVGRCALWNGEIDNCVHQNHVIRCRPIEVAISPFVLRFLNSPDGMAVMRRLAITSSGLYSLSVGKIRQIEVPLPPMAEQQRIVAKVEELMAVCDRLEVQLTTARTEGRRLLEAVLDEALAPVS
jgi:type I restriction enzyme, S subunit